MGKVTDYNSIKVGLKTLDDAVLNLGVLKKYEQNYNNKGLVLRALAEKDIKELREISEYFYAISGIYKRTCDLFAFLYRYDWYVVPEVYDNKIYEKEKEQEKLLKDFQLMLHYLDNSHIKKICGDIALEVIKKGAYYGYLVPSDDKIILQQLPINYCRSRYFKGDTPAIEFNMKFFDEQFRDINYRMRVLKMFPKEFAKGYVLYKQGKLQPDFAGDAQGSWYLLDPDSTVKFNINNNDTPIFVNAIPAILDLDAAQDLDRRKQMQKLLKIIVQKLPRDKNGDLIFDVDEARDLHNNAVEMLRRAVGTDVLTTFADVESIDMSDRNTATTVDDLQKVERTIFNALGISQNLFNTDGNLSLEKSILNDESMMKNLLLQFHIFFDKITQVKYGKSKKYNFRLYMLETTQYNYKDLSKMYKEQVQIGYSKMLPQIALGHSQSSILHTAHFENEILNLSGLMLPPLMSSTLSGEDLMTITGKGNKEGNAEAGRPEKAEDEKSEKTLQNLESMG